jgi:hypothetical protein
MPCCFEALQPDIAFACIMHPATARKPFPRRYDLAATIANLLIPATLLTGSFRDQVRRSFLSLNN